MFNSINIQYSSSQSNAKYNPKSYYIPSYKIS